MTVPRCAIIPTRNRPDYLAALISQLKGQCEHVIVIDNDSSPPLSTEYFHVIGHDHVNVIHDSAQPPHLYRMWNRAFDELEAAARALRQHEWDVAVFNDDTVLPSGWYDYVSAGLRSSTAAVACTYAHPGFGGGAPYLKTHQDHNIGTRMCPWAFIVKGELGLRADESMHWWWGDTDFDWQACQRGGVLLMPGYTTQNVLANSTTHGVLAEQAGRDGETFARKWGVRPW